MIFVIVVDTEVILTQRDVGRNTHQEHKHRKYQIRAKSHPHLACAKAAKLYPHFPVLLTKIIRQQ